MTTSRSLRRGLVAAMTAALVAMGLTVATVPVQATTTFDLTRIQGENRFGTAAEIAQATYASAATAIVANGRSFPDPLAASYLAGAETAPILLAETDKVPQATLDALASLGVSEVILVGGTAVLSQDVQDELEDEGYTVRRVAGANRYITARAVAEDPGADNAGSTGENGVTAFLATGTAFPDSLSAGGGAYAGQLPLLLTRPGSLHPAAAAAFDNLGIEHVVILGGTGAVSQAVQDEIEDGGRTTERLAGANRFQTNVAVAEWLIDTLEFSTTHIDVATGRNFADALAGSTHSGENERVIVLTGSVPQSACNFLTSHEGTLEGGDIFGGTAAVDAATEDNLEECGGRAESRAGIVTAVDTDGSGNDNVNAGSYTVTDEAGTHLVVRYDAFLDEFEVDGNQASLQAFEANLTVGDEIEFFEVGSDNPDTANVDDDADVHRLTNVEDRNEGMAGNIDTTDDTFVIVEPFSGVVISEVKDYTGGTFTIDGSTATLAEFEQDVNEGDSVVISGTSFALTNRTVTGQVTSFNVLVDEVGIGNLGDDPTNAQDDRYDWETGAPTTIFRVDGASVTPADFEDDLSVPDQLSYAKQNGAQVLSLTNVAPVVISGTAADGTGLAPNFGTNVIKVVDGASTTDINYTGVPRYFVNGVLVVETEFEDAYTAGDQITFTPDDGATTADESKIELHDADLIGRIRDVTTGENRYDVVNANGTTIYNDLDYTAAIFGGSDTYSVEGAPVPEPFFEGAIGGADNNDQIRVSQVPPGGLSGVQTNHAYTSVD